MADETPVVDDTEPVVDDTEPATTDDQTQDDFKSEESKQRVLADLHKERDQRKALEAKLAEIERSQMSEMDKAVADARAEGRQEAEQALSGTLVASQVRAAAVGRLADPQDATRFLDLSTYSIDEHGNIDSADVTKAIDELVKERPYLAAAATPRPLAGSQNDRAGAPGTLNAWLRGGR